MIVGIIGKPNVGKSTLFSAATLLNVPIANYPFTTIKPNVGVGYVRVPCVCSELGVKDNPVNSVCIQGTRLIPAKLVDVAGLVPGASQGRGLGNQFLDELRQADALIHTVDASGSTDREGKACPPGSHDPMEDIDFVEEEFDLWVAQIIQHDWGRLARSAEASGKSLAGALSHKLSGLSVTEADVSGALLDSGLKEKNPTQWSNADLHQLIRTLRRLSKPALIAGNKCDLPKSRENIETMSKTGKLIVPCAAEAELLLRRAAEKKLISYTPGDAHFGILDPAKLNEDQRRALQLVQERVLNVWGSTGVQEAVNSAFLKLLRGVTVYPVEDEKGYSDKSGNVLPHAYIMRSGSTPVDLANKVHSELGAGFLYAIDAKTGLRLASDYRLANGDVIKIVSTARRG